MDVLLVGILVGVASIVHSASPASAVTTRLTIGAGLGNCPAGYVCLWPRDNFQGTGYAFYSDESDYHALPSPFYIIDNYSMSFYNHANTYDIRFYRYPAKTGDTFVLCKGDSIASLPPVANTDTTPGAWYRTGKGWRGQVSGHDFGAWC
ncbi:peptidase inhibitor family I36 protein [Micromonospora chersina]|uniref:peptidase inhibitor family I36 protein n=1 Tax=Micromonospora chersina TaxID=47854 RepID=UPI0033E735A1